MTAASLAGLIVALLVIARLAVVCHRLSKERRHTDPITGLPSRLGFEAILADQLKINLPLSVVSLNLDGFRRFNDLRGHAGGDAVLAQIGPRIRRSLRPGDAMGRFGGDQFLIALHGHDTAAAVTQRILRTIDASAGVSLYPDHADSAAKLILLAETAMWEAKTKARGCAVMYEPSMAANSVRSAEIANLIQSALKNDYFRLVYQPIVNASGGIVRMEALVRIEDPVLGHMAPAEFIGVAEHTGLIHEVGAWVLSHACRQAHEWRDAGFEIHMALNMSPLQLATARLADHILGIVDEAGLSPSAVAIEITGLIGLTGPVETLRSAGIRISTQQWGEANPMFDGVRVREPFDIPADWRDRFTIIAHGIEEPDQLDRARAAGCHLFQGFQIAPPLEPKDATAILRAGLFAGSRSLVGS